MKKLFLLLILFSMPAFAQENAAAILVDAQTCARLLIETDPEAVDYVPGVDASGRPVVEADLNPSPIVVPKDIEADITVDLLGSGVHPMGAEAKASIGRLRYDGSRFYFNGNPLEGPAMEAVRQACREIQSAKPSVN